VSFIGFEGRDGLGVVRCALVAGVFGALLGGCVSSSGSDVQVVDRNGSYSQRQPVTVGQHRVQRGDTLYSIAFRYGWDWKALAAHNGIVAPYTIRVGQTIRFGGVGASRSAAVPAQPARTDKTSTASRVVTPPKSASASKSAAPDVGQTPSAAALTGWVWPAGGAIIGRYASNGSLNKGIDIAGNMGEPILAASDGAVVYAGSGLRGYGELVIIKHNDTYVSAYGHNRRLLVHEGQQVKVGQKIAEMGSTGTDRVKLHFEIRRQGKPVDPMQYLPRR
jgi:lipoprotein NlpD